MRSNRSSSGTGAERAHYPATRDVRELPMTDTASLSDAERAKLYRSYADAMRRQADSAGGGMGAYFLRMAESWDQLAGSIEQLAGTARTDPKKSPKSGPELP
jgi:hypothetical protein